MSNQWTSSFWTWELSDDRHRTARMAEAQPLHPGRAPYGAGTWVSSDNYHVGEVDREASPDSGVGAARFGAPSGPADCPRIQLRDCGLSGTARAPEAFGVLKSCVGPICR